MNKPNIVLIGFMGTGKTTIGRILAKKLNKKLIEMDDLIVCKAGKSIPRIFAEDGEIRFREIEMSVCKELGSYENVVISAGGGIILNKLNVDYLKEKGYIVLLEATAQDIYERILLEGKEKRPLLNKPNPFSEIRKLLSFRKPFYNAAAEFKVMTHNKMPEQIADEIIEIINQINQMGGIKSQILEEENLGKLFERLSKDIFEKSIDKDKIDTKENNIKLGDLTISSKINVEIIEKCVKYVETEPINLVNDIFKKFSDSMTKKQLNSLVPGILLACMRNIQRKNNNPKLQFILPQTTCCVEAPITKEKIVTGMMRSTVIPYDSDAYLGICEEIIGLGIALSLAFNVTPQNKHYIFYINKITSNILQQLNKNSSFIANPRKERIIATINVLLNIIENK
ncbi:MAG: shikimate kinase [Promethearchaeota archaeon]